MPLAKSRSVHIAGTTVARTPLLLPSFSSLALERDNLEEAVRRTIGIVVGAVLISAYDLDASAFDLARTRDGRPVFDAPLTFIDSGGYETIRAPDPEWTPERHSAALQRWPANAQAVMVGYDHPSEELREQISSVLDLLPGRRIGRELLIKPMPGVTDMRERGGILNLIEQLPAFTDLLTGIDVIGITEKEAGSTLRQRLNTVASLRRTLANIGSDLPIHYFGGLDPALAPMFFLAGADIFDGLSWLRYAYTDGQAHYLEPAAALAHPDMDIAEARWLIRKRNYAEITSLEMNLQRYLVSGEPKHLHPNGEAMVRNFIAAGLIAADQ